MLAVGRERESDFRALVTIVKLALHHGDAVAMMDPLDETLDHATLLFQTAAGRQMELENGNCDEGRHGEVGWLRPRSVPRAWLEGRRDLLLLVDLDEVTRLEVLETVEADAAVEAAADLGGVVLEPSK